MFKKPVIFHEESVLIKVKNKINMNKFKLN